MTDIPAKLAAPFVPDIVSWRVGSTTQDKKRGMAMCYIDARDVMRRLDEAVGPENWQDEYPWSDGKRVVCRIGIKIDGEWVWKGDGAGDTDYEGEKGALSDAFKRAAVKWGIGRYLYDVDAPWVAIEQHGKSFTIQAGELPKLRARLPRPDGHVTRAAAPQPAERPIEDIPPVSAVDTGQMIQARAAAQEAFFRRPSYRIDPGKVGWPNWDRKMLSAFQAARTRDEFAKIIEDNAHDFTTWADTVVAPPVVVTYRKRVFEIQEALARTATR